MRLAPCTRSTPLRLTAILLLIFALSLLVCFGAAYGVVRANFDAILRDQVRQTMVSYRSIADTDDLHERLVADAAAIDPKSMILHYTPDSGLRIANVGAFPPVSGFSVVSEKAVAGEHDLADSYLALSARVGAGQLIVAETREQVVEMREVFLTVFLVGLLPTLGIASAAGLLVARRARCKIEAIDAMLQDLTSGHLQARVRVDAGEADDLSQIGLAVNRMAAAQEASMASLKQVSADIAHDLKTPIQRVAVLLDQLATKTALAPIQKDIIDRASAETERIVKTFQALLQIAQIEGGSVRERFMPVALNDVALDIVDVYGPAAEESGHRLELSVAGPGPFTVFGDKHLLGQVMANLIENGLRHVPPGGRISVELARSAGNVVLVVGDDGPGVPASERDRVLRRLYRLERSRTSDGSGLGLSLVAAICSLHDATLLLDDNTPGLVVRIAFPD